MRGLIKYVIIFEVRNFWMVPYLIGGNDLLLCSSIVRASSQYNCNIHDADSLTSQEKSTKCHGVLRPIRDRYSEQTLQLSKAQERIKVC